MSSKTHEMIETQDGLLVRHVPLMLPMNAGDKGLTEALGEPWFAAAKRLFDERKALGKLPRFKAGHADESPVIGRIVGMDISEKPWMYVDILTTEPDAIAKFKRGEMPSLSAEFCASMEFPLLWGVACTQGDMGHFDHEKPDFMPPELTERLKSLNATLVRCAAPKDKTMATKPKADAPAPAAVATAPAVDGFGTTPSGSAPAAAPKAPAVAPSVEDELTRVQKENQELLIRVGNLEKAAVKAREDAAAAAAKEFQPTDPEGEEKPKLGPDGKPMPDAMGDMKEDAMADDKDAAAGEKSPVAGEKKPAFLAADELLEKGSVYAAAKRGTSFVVLKGDEVLRTYSEKTAALDYFTSLESHARKDRLTLALTSLKDSGCPLRASEIMTRLNAAKTDADVEVERVKLASIPKWQDLAKGDGAKLKGDGTALSAKEQVTLYLANCDASGMPRQAAIVKLSREMPELYEAWTGARS